MGSCIAGQANGVKVQIYHNDDCADEPQFYPVATDSCLGGNMKVKCNAAGEASIEIHEHNNNQCNGNPVVSVTFTAAEDKCHSFGNPNEEKAQPGDDQCPTTNEPDKTNYCGPLQDQPGEPSEWVQGFVGSCHSCAAPPEIGNCTSYTSMIETGGCYSTCARK